MSNIVKLQSATYCLNGNRWSRCRGIIDVDAAGMSTVKCDCKAFKRRTKIKHDSIIPVAFRRDMEELASELEGVGL